MATRQQRLDLARARERREDRRNRTVLVGVVVLAVVAVVALVAVAVRHKNAPATRTTAPPWPAPSASDVPRLVRDAGLPVLAMEATDVHYHAHLDVIVDGQAVTVPAQIGIAANGISALHTHTPDGIVHVESPTPQTFTLGQLFTEWDVRLTRTCLGGLCTEPLHVYVNGAEVTTDPRAIVLAKHQEIAIVYGTLPAGPPASYTFPSGL